MEREIFDDEHRAFRKMVRTYIQREIAPHHKEWEKDGIVPRAAWQKAGQNGLLCMSVPEQYGGGGEEDYRFSAILIEEFVASNCTGPGFSIHSDIIVPYINNYASVQQKDRWLPDLVSGEKIAAIAMTEPGAGSDLAAIEAHAVDAGDYYVLNGSKTFISNGINADLVIVACKTAPEKKLWGISLLVVERGMNGFSRGNKLEKIGWRAMDTAELFFDDVQVPKENLLGSAGQGFFLLTAELARERLVIAVGAMAAARSALDQTVEYSKQREAFGKPIGSFQNSRFKLAEMETEITIGQVFIDRCIMKHNDGKLTATEAAMVKWWSTDLQKRVIDQCLQLHGGYGYMLEYPIAQAWLDMRWSSIGGGTNEIMKDLIGQDMGL